MTKYELRMTVCAEKEFANEEEAIEWIDNHTIFDLLDTNGAIVIDDYIYDLPSHDLIYDGGAERSYADAQTHTEESEMTTDEIRAELAKQGKIAVIWCVEDVQTLAKLDHDQAMYVLQEAEHDHNAEIGINWDVLRSQIEWTFPEAKMLDGTEDEDEDDEAVHR